MTIAEVVAKQVFCVDCEHIAGSSTHDWERFRCRAPQNIQDKELNLVTGNDIIRWKVEFCTEARKAGPYCNPQGLWYKERVFTIDTTKLLKAVDKKSISNEL